MGREVAAGEEDEERGRGGAVAVVEDAVLKVGLECPAPPAAGAAMAARDLRRAENRGRDRRSRPD